MGPALARLASLSYVASWEPPPETKNKKWIKKKKNECNKVAWEPL